MSPRKSFLAETDAFTETYAHPPTKQDTNQTLIVMDKMKQKYEKPLVKIKVIAVEDGFATSSLVEGFTYGDDITW